MSFSLHGPFPFDVNAVTTSARAALGKVNAALEAGLGERLLETAAIGEDAGLYVVLTTDGTSEPRIAGFWVVFGLAYFDDGVTGPPERHPPYAKGLLDAMIEEVWWRNLKVATDRRGGFNPVVVLEWLPSLAVRSSLYPPGVDGGAMADAAEDDLPEVIAELTDLESADEGDEDWLAGGELEEVPEDELGEAATVPEIQVEMSMDEDEEATADDELPGARSLLCVVQGRLTHDSITHHGEFWVAMPSAEEGASSHSVGVEHWAEGQAKRKLRSKRKHDEMDDDEPHRLGPPMDLPGDRVGFPMTGWLTRNLGVWPPGPAAVHGGELTDRIVQSRWQSQALMGISSTLAVFVLVLMVTLLIRVATVPRPQETAAAPPPAAQPAMSVCSADHHKFVTEFRCQVGHFADPYGEEGPVCSDMGSTQVVDATTEDLRPLYCGLLDREKDGWLGNFSGTNSTGLYNFAELAASQSCFNVLGHPHPYTQGTGQSAGTWALADPELFLVDPALRIQSLVDLVADLEEACDAYLTRMEHRVEGAILATHVGATVGATSGTAAEAAQLRQNLINGSMVGTAEDAERCFRLGSAEGLDVYEYAELCGEPDSTVRRLAQKKIWMQLAGSPVPTGEPDPLIPRYVAARFGAAGAGDTSNLWKCHLNLSGTASGLIQRRLDTRWDLWVPIPDKYDIAGGQAVRTQLSLDAALLDFEEGLTGGTCWKVVDKRLDQYAPVHPLVADLDDSIWFSTEQQLCGQVCATFYDVQNSAKDATWVTREADLSRCITSSAPRETPDLGRGDLDRLRVPWNGTRSTGWIAPSAAEICAFNLIAQDYMPAAEEESYLVGGKATAQWAGETATGSRIAGGEDGLATKGAENMSSYGRSRSSNTCGYVAAQCFTSTLIDIIDSGRYERYEWRDTWMDRLVDLSSATPVTVRKYTPWCQLVQPYLHPDGNLPEGEIDFPCASGVDQALRNVEGSIRILAKDTNVGRTP